ncbi:type VI secretion system-associated protein TagF [Caulobacter sp. LARHSG274]
MAVSAPFLFGKLPAHGDFVSRGLDGAGRDAWDVAASRLLDTAQSRLGADFAEAHGQAPPWRFVCGPGPLGPDWRAGVLAPSVDSAGRRFVLALGWDGLPVEEAHRLAGACGQAMEALAYDAIGQGLTADEVMARLGDLAETEDAAAAPLADDGAWWTLDMSGAVALARRGAEPPADLLILSWSDTAVWRADDPPLSDS